MKLRIIIGLVCLAGLLALAGCGPKTDAKAYGALLEGYMGQHIDQLVNVWGPPQSRYDYADGRRMYSFVRISRDYSAGGPLVGFGGGWGSWGGGWGGVGLSTAGAVQTYSCETRVITDKKGYVTDYSFRGNACNVERGTDGGQAPARLPDGGPAWATVCGPGSSPDCGPAYPPGWGPAHGPW